MVYLLIVNIAMAIGFGLYQLFFKKLTFFQWNRFYLLGMVIISLLIPIGIYIDLSAYFVQEEILPTIHFTEIDDIIVYASYGNSSSLYLLDILKWGYAAGITCSLVVFIYQLWKLKKAFRYDSSYSSFSFFSKVILGSQVKDIKEISDHELVHVEQGHSYDIVLMELVSIFNWFNPVVYFIKKELKFQHECIADEICSTDKVSYAELLLAHAMKTDVNILRHEFSNQSFLKKRIMMLFKNKSTNNKKYLYLSVLPLVGIVVFSTLLFNTSKAKEIVRDVGSGVEEVKMSANSLKVDNLMLSNNYLQEDTTKNRRNNKQNGNSPDLIFESVEIQPEPPGGMQAFRKWIGDNYQYPQSAIDAGLKGAIEVSFIVEKSGNLSDFKIEKDLGYGTGDAAVEMLKNAPKWKPGIQNGKKVRVIYTLPIRLDLTSDEENKSPLSRQENLGHQIFESVEIQPKPPGGMTSFRKWIGDNYQYPQAAIDAGLKGTIQASFIVEKDGSLSDFKIVRDLGDGTGEAAIELFKKSPKWSPGIQNGRLVRVAYTIPIRIDLTK